MTERLHVGDRVSFVAQRLHPHSGREEYEVGGTVTARHKGGFYGEVFEVNDSDRGETIIKTARATGLIHRLGKFLNWDGKPFPPQVSETAALADYVSQKIARGFIPAATGVYTPDAYGTGFLPSYGYVQEMEKLYGRPPSYLRGLGEYDRLMQARRAIFTLGMELGNVNWAGQAHPDNVFGLQNLWIGLNGSVILVDQLPGIRHKGEFLGLKLPFLAFQREIGMALGNGNIVYNEIDTNLHRTALDHDPRFSGLDKSSLHGFLDIYDDLAVRLKTEQSQSLLEQNIAALILLGVINREPRRLREWATTMLSLSIRQGKVTTKEFAERVGENMFIRMMTEKGYFKLFFSGLSLLEEGYKSGTVPQADWLAAKSLVFDENEALSPEQRKKIRNYVSLLGTYLTSSAILNVAGAVAFTATEVTYPGNHLLATTLGFTFATALPAALRYLSAKPFTWITKQNADIVRSLSPIPTVGTLAPLAQMAANPELASTIAAFWPLTVRGLAAKASKLLPWGGWGTDLEARIMKFLFRKHEKIQRWFGVPAFFKTEERVDSSR